MNLARNAFNLLFLIDGIKKYNSMIYFSDFKHWVDEAQISGKSSSQSIIELNQISLRIKLILISNQIANADLQLFLVSYYFFIFSGIDHIGHNFQ